MSKKKKFNQLHILLGFVNDKDLDVILPLFPKNASYYFCRPNIIRGLDVGVLVEKANDHGLLGNAYDSIHEALKAARKHASKSDFIFIGGSNFTVAEVV